MGLHRIEIRQGPMFKVASGRMWPSGSDTFSLKSFKPGFAFESDWNDTFTSLLRLKVG